MTVDYILQEILQHCRQNCKAIHLLSLNILWKVYFQNINLKYYYITFIELNMCGIKQLCGVFIL